MVQVAMNRLMLRRLDQGDGGNPGCLDSRARSQWALCHSAASPFRPAASPFRPPSFSHDDDGRGADFLRRRENAAKVVPIASRIVGLGSGTEATEMDVRAS
jgi:hypothetical protein